MVKCHYTDHHHKWFCEDFNGWIIECEYCDAKAATDEFGYKVANELCSLLTRDWTKAVQAVGDWMWEERQTKLAQPLASASIQAIHSCLFGSTEGSLPPLPAGCSPLVLEESPSAETTQSPGCTQSSPRRPSDYYSDLHAALHREYLSLDPGCSEVFLEALVQLETGSISVPLQWEGTIYKMQSREELLELYHILSSIGPSDPDKP